MTWVTQASDPEIGSGQSIAAIASLHYCDLIEQELGKHSGKELRKNQQCLENRAARCAVPGAFAPLLRATIEGEP